MKKLTLEIGDDTNAELVERIEIKHLSDLGCEVKNAIEDFVKLNDGIMLPPISIHVTEEEPVSPGRFHRLS